MHQQVLRKDENTTASEFPQLQHDTTINPELMKAVIGPPRSKKYNAVLPISHSATPELRHRRRTDNTEVALGRNQSSQSNAATPIDKSHAKSSS